LLGRRDVRLLLVGQAASELGSQVGSIALPLVAVLGLGRGRAGRGMAQAEPGVARLGVLRVGQVDAGLVEAAAEVSTAMTRPSGR
jgi:hypothetical protein